MSYSDSCFLEHKSLYTVIVHEKPCFAVDIREIGLFDQLLRMVTTLAS